MTREEKRLLLIDLCTRLPYRVIIKSVGENKIIGLWDLKDVDNLPLPYLRSLSSMTEEEIKEFRKNSDFEEREAYEVRANGENKIVILQADCDLSTTELDWLNAHHFDYRGLIEKGLALEAPDGVYNKEESEKGSEIPIPKTVDEAVKTLDKIVSNPEVADAPYAIVTNTKTGKWFRAKKCSMTMTRYTNLSVDMTFSVTPDGIKDTIPVIGTYRLADGMTKKELVGDNAEIHVEIFNKDKIKQYEYFLYNAWISSIDSETNEIVLTYDYRRLRII